MRIASLHEHHGSAADGFSAVHFLSGCALGALGVPLTFAGLAAVGWEMAEQRLKHRAPKADSNALIDCLAVVAGCYAARVLRR